MKRKNLNKIPSEFQGILWSANVRELDLEEDKNYIIHQVLMYGSLEQIRWLFRTYKKEEIKKVFIENPVPIYTKPIFYFIKNIILNLKKKLDEKKYIKNIIGPFR
ncbi:MAG: hypothetical protein COS47_00935 [Candidatus Nealsonbacteria bacterium CG03_land_8_20_14_0_80_36_12]|uniref:DUF6922 domain-containing protein n=1 Tax=Candidatus Nealsonbacteria bacterium CG03_land_8_20_14_0_80_36_12 TaxID=1974701 RepID=A0A2M7BYH6_9BACT|nr:MAG: hypothetical protein COS47_00935 [Candidatus Nealsonbacteria bacterium CG03_land_8_20_14_0_80_36_12]